MTRLRRIIQQNPLKSLSITLWILVIIIAQSTMQNNSWTVADLTDELGRLMRDTEAGFLLFILAYLVKPFFLFPATFLLLIAGLIYGFPGGFALSMFASVTTATWVYWAGRWLVRVNLQAISPRLQGFVEFMRRNPFEAILSMYFLYISSDIISILAGTLNLRFRRFMIAQIIGRIPGTVIAVSLGASLESSISEGELQIDAGMIALSLSMLVVSLSLSAYIRKRQGKKQVEKIDIKAE